MKVLVGVDGSKFGWWAMEWAARVPFAEPATVAAVHVMDLASLRAPVMIQPVVIGTEKYIQEEIRRAQAHGKRVAADAKAHMAALGLAGKVLLERGAVAASILRHAGRGSLTVLGHRGLGAMDRFLLGSVSSQVATHAGGSVLVVKEAPRPLRKVLLATDGSQSSRKTVQFLLRRLKPRLVLPNDVPVDVEVAVIHVMPFLRYPELKEAGRALVHRCAEQLAKAGYRVVEVLKVGHAAAEIIRLAERWKADLIVAGAKGHGAVARFFLGSVSTKLVHHSPCSVLLVR